MSDQDEQILEIFREEAGERMDRMVDVLLAVEAGQSPQDATDALFRDAHSLKGGAGLLGLEELHVIADAVEEILSELRSSDSQLPASSAAAVLEAVDAMRRAIAGEAGVAKPALAALGKLEDPGAEESPGDVPEQSPLSPADDAPPSGEPVGRAAGGDPDPGASVRVAADKVDRLLTDVDEAILHQRGLGHMLESTGDERVREALDRSETLLDELQHSSLQLRTRPLASIVGTFPRFVRDLAVTEGKQALLTLSGTETQLDKAILEGISESILHVLRNSIAHGIEPPEERAEAGKPERGRIELHAEQRGGLVAIEIKDDGRGVSPELLREAGEHGSLAALLARPGFSTAESVSGLAGRGVGLDAVKSHVESLGGGIEARSEPGRGTSITLVLPLTLAILQVLLVERGEHVLGVPVSNVAEVVLADEPQSLEGRKSLVWREATVPLADIATVLGAPVEGLGSRPPALVVTHSGTTVALTCDRLRGEEDVVVKSLGPILSATPGYLGAAILAEGRTALIVDPAAAVAAAPGAAGDRTRAPTTPAASSVTETKLLVVDDQFTIRELQRSILEAAGYRVVTANDGRDALEQLELDEEITLVVTDLQMPEMDGLELLRSVRKNPRLTSLPVVVVTSLGSDEDRQRGLEAGADAYVTKDRFDQRVLLETVERLVGR